MTGQVPSLVWLVVGVGGAVVILALLLHGASRARAAGQPARSRLVPWVAAIGWLLPFLPLASFHAYYIPSSGMRPTLIQGDRLLTNMLAYAVSDPRRGDLIVFAAPPQAIPGGGRRTFVRRAIGLPGEEVEVRRLDGVHINGRKLSEPYIPADQVADYDYGPVRIPKGDYFVLGDNRRDSNDSHHWGFLPRANILGKVIWRFAPPGRAGAVH